LNDQFCSSEAKGGRVKLPTVEDVARSAQVSRQTVSNVLNSPAIVTPATRARVEAAIAQLGYRPNLSARRLRQRKSETIGIRLDPQLNGISGAVLDRFLHAVTEQADARGMRMLLFTAASPAEEIEQIRRLRDGADVDAFVLTATFDHDPRPDWLIANNVPFVTFGRPWGIDDMDEPHHRWVDIDGRLGVYDATVHLIERGATAIAWVGWPGTGGTGGDRRAGWADAMRERLGCSEADLERLTSETHDGVAEATAVATARLAERPDLHAMVCASDTLALGAMIAAASAGQPRLPVIGFDNTPVAAALGISSIEQRLGEAAAGALDLLLGPEGNAVLPNGEQPGASHRLIAPTLVVRDPQNLPLHDPTGVAGTDAEPLDRKETE
jgi:DNA-binding LacI/PurR family transcriptional regulator